MSKTKMYGRYYSPDEERTYFICEDCEPISENDEFLEELPDDCGTYRCEQCGMEWDDISETWVNDDDYEITNYVNKILYISEHGN